MFRSEFANHFERFAAPADIRKFAKGSHSDIHKFTAHSRRVREFADGYTRVRESPRRVRDEFATSSRVREIPQVCGEFAKVRERSADGYRTSSHKFALDIRVIRRDIASLRDS